MPRYKKLFMNPGTLYTSLDTQDCKQLEELAIARNQTRCELLRDLAIKFLEEQGVPPRTQILDAP